MYMIYMYIYTHIFSSCVVPLVFFGGSNGVALINRHQKISLVGVQYFSLVPEDQVEELPGVWTGVDLVGPVVGR